MTIELLTADIRSKFWNTLPVNIKTAENLNAFKGLMKKWNGV